MGEPISSWAPAWTKKGERRTEREQREGAVSTKSRNKTKQIEKKTKNSLKKQKNSSDQTQKAFLFNTAKNLTMTIISATVRLMGVSLNTSEAFVDTVMRVSEEVNEHELTMTEAPEGIVRYRPVES